MQVLYWSLILSLSLIGACKSSGDDGGSGDSVADVGDASDADDAHIAAATDGAVQGDTSADGSTSTAGDAGAGAADGGTTTGATADAATDGETQTATDGLGLPDGTWEVPDELKLCGDRACACANGLDDDGDGVADGFDAECIGPNDDDEGSFSTGISGDNQDPKWQDCFFDGNSGAGDDDCKYHTDCIAGIKPPSDPDCQVSDFCVEFCSARTPSGCDCFGCCEIKAPEGGTAQVYITEECDADALETCTSCQKAVDVCDNPCGECELCPSQGVEDLPESCFDQGGSDPGDGGVPEGGGSADDGGSSEPVPLYTCDQGRNACGSTQDCGSGEYCSFGCCVLYTLE